MVPAEGQAGPSSMALAPSVHVAGQGSVEQVRILPSHAARAHAPHALLSHPDAACCPPFSLSLINLVPWVRVTDANRNRTTRKVRDFKSIFIRVRVDFHYSLLRF